MPYLTKDQLILPRKDGNGNPTQDRDWHTLPTENGEGQIFGYMGDDDEAYWHYTLGFFTHGTGLELGSFYGYSAILAGLGMKHSPWNGKLIAVDWFSSTPYLAGDNTLERFNENLRKFGVEDHVTGVQGSCEDPKVIPFTELEWVFFDASHCIKELRVNMEIFGPMVKSGGLYMWHDVGQPEVREHIAECRKEQNLIPVVTGWKDMECWMKPMPPAPSKLSIFEMWESGNTEKPE